MRYPLMLAFAGLCALPLVEAAPQARAATGASRQYYGPWVKHPRQSYYYRPYYYKPRASYSGYKHHYAVYYPARPKHVYYYNPYKKVYWGRCPSSHGGNPTYSLLEEKDRKGDVDAIEESAFPKEGDVPTMPDADDGTKMDLVPDDLPPASAAALPTK